MKQTYKCIDNTLTEAVKLFSNASENGDSRLNNYPAQKILCENLMDEFGKLEIPLSVWTEDSKCQIFFPSKNLVKIGRKAKDMKYTGNPLRVVEERVLPITDLELGETYKFVRRAGDDYVTRLSDHLQLDLGLREKLDLRTHIINVMIDMMQRLDCFLVQHSFSEKQTFQLRKYMLLVCMIHDGGKYFATVFGDKNWQQLLSIPMVQYMLKEMNASDYEIELASAIIELNLYGDLLFSDIFGYTADALDVVKMNNMKYHRLQQLDAKWDFMNEDVFKDLTHAYFVADAIGGYSFARVVSGYIRPGAIIAEGVNTGLKFYDVLRRCIYSYREEICLEDIIAKSPEVLEFLSTSETLPSEEVLFGWFSSGQLRITDLIRWFDLKKKQMGITDTMELASKNFLYEKDLFHEDAKEHLTEEEARFLYKTMPIVPEIHTRHNDKRVWGIINEK